MILRDKEKDAQFVSFGSSCFFHQSVTFLADQSFGIYYLLVRF